MRRQFARQHIVFHTEGGGRADRLAADGAATENARAREAELGRADISPRKEEVADVARIVGTIRNRIDASEMMAVAGQDVEIQKSMRRMEIDTPAAVGDGIVELAVFQNVAFVQHVVAEQTAALAHAGQCANPFERKVFRAMLTAVLNVIPQAVGVGHQVVADFLIVGNDVIAVAHEFEPPVAVIDSGATACGQAEPFLRIGGHARVDFHRFGMDAVAELMLRQLFSEGGRLVFDRMARIDGFHENRIAHAFVVGLVGSVRLAVFFVRFASLRVVRSREIAERAVACGVHEQRRGDLQRQFRRLLEAGDGGDDVAIDGAVEHRAVQIDGQILFVFGGFEENHVPDGVIERVVAALVFEHQFVEQA